MPSRTSRRPDARPVPRLRGRRGRGVGPAVRAGRGFSLLELVVVMAIVAVVAAAAAPRFAAAAARARVEGAAQRLAADLRTARAAARASSEPVVVRFDASTASYQLAPGRGEASEAARAALAAVKAGALVSLAGEPYGAVMPRVGFEGQTRLVFDGFGVAGADGAVLLRVGRQGREVRVDAGSGAITVVAAAPAGAAPASLEGSVEVGGAKVEVGTELEGP